jgi:hypothetical protein
MHVAELLAGTYSLLWLFWQRSFWLFFRHEQSKGLQLRMLATTLHVAVLCICQLLGI